MPRMPRLVVPHYPHHVTQRGNRRQTTFFSPSDYRCYIDLLSEAKSNAEVEIWSYCLLPNHVHLIVVPELEDSLSKLFKEAHRRYTRYINLREDWQGHLWQERFHSCVMDEPHLMAAARYIELNPVRARLCKTPTEWPWSSVHAHLRGKDDALVSVHPMLSRINDWSAYLSTGGPALDMKKLTQHARSGRPLGGQSFLTDLEALTGRDLCKRSPGRKPNK